MKPLVLDSLVDALTNGADLPFHEAARLLLNCLGYRSDRTLEGQTGQVGDLPEAFEVASTRCGRCLHHSDIPRLVKHYVQAIGLDPAEYSGHSLRAGFVTSAAVHRARLDKIMEVTRHSSAEMVLRYIRQVEAFEDHAGAAFL